jgi:hypothetical protein
VVLQPKQLRAIQQLAPAKPAVTDIAATRKNARTATVLPAPAKFVTATQFKIPHSKKSLYFLSLYGIATY